MPQASNPWLSPSPVLPPTHWLQSLMYARSTFPARRNTINYLKKKILQKDWRIQNVNRFLQFFIRRWKMVSQLQMESRKCLKIFLQSLHFHTVTIIIFNFYFYHFPIAIHMHCKKRDSRFHNPSLLPPGIWFQDWCLQREENFCANFLFYLIGPTLSYRLCLTVYL